MSCCPNGIYAPLVIGCDGQVRPLQSNELLRANLIDPTANVLTLQSEAEPQDILIVRTSDGAQIGAIRITSAGDYSYSLNAGVDYVIQLAGLVFVRIGTNIVFQNAPFIINETGGDFDTRIEGDTLTHLAFVDASESNIAFIASAAPNWQSMQGGLFIGNSSSVPSGNPSGGGFLYVEAGALKYRGSSGTVTTLGVA